MFFKRVFVKNDEGEKIFAGVQVLRHSNVQHFTAKTLSQAVNQGWGELIGENTFRIHNTGGADLIYAILQSPGCYCCYCGDKLEQTRAREHVATHEGSSPDTDNPAGYVVQNYFNCILKENEI